MSTGDADGPVLDAEQFDRLASYGTEEEVQPGQDLYAAGDNSYDFFLLRTATAEAVRDATALDLSVSSTGADRASSSAN